MEKRKYYLENAGRDDIFFMISLVSYYDNEEEVIKKIRELENVDKTDMEGTSYLHLAAQLHRLNIIKALLEKGANPNITDHTGHTPISAAIGSINDKNPEILEVFLKYGADLNRKMGDQTIKEFIYEVEDEELIKVIEKHSLNNQS